MRCPVMGEAALKAFKDIDRIMPPSCEITAEDPMEEITVVMERNSILKLTRFSPERRIDSSFHVSSREH